MRKIFVCLLVVLMSLSLPIQADNNVPIKFNQLPKTAQQLIQKYFKNEKVVMVIKEKDWLDISYAVQFQCGSKIEFAKDGIWKELSTRGKSLPLSLIPSEIKTFVKTYYPEARIMKIEKDDKNGYEVKLSNRNEIKFDKKYNVIDMDID